jgi:tetratricopeptide (TPR) repeat protein
MCFSLIAPFRPKPSGSLSVVSGLLCLVLTALASTSARAQLDRVYQLSGSPISGKITEIKPDGVTIESGSNKQTIAVDQIQKIFYEGDPAPLTKGREFALDGQWEQAVEELRQIDINSLKRDAIKADAMFYLSKSEAQLALVGRGSTAEAVKKLMAFVSGNAQSIHFYSSAKLLGDLAVAMGSYDKATQYYSVLARAPAIDLKIESVYLTGLAKLRQGKPADAMADFDKVIGAPVQSTAALRMQVLAKAGRAVALSQQGKGDEGLKLVDSLISDLNPADSEMAARIYNAQGASYEASGDALGAVMAYLHTHLMFSGQADAHAEALARLVELWPKVGKADRAAQARSELQERYPGWGKQ